jgi:hypothetical protein
MDFDGSRVRPGQVTFGAFMIALGLVFLMDRMEMLRPALLAAFWPGLLVAWGLTRIVWPSRAGAEVAGLWIALIGGLLVLDRLAIISLSESWPVLVIVAGLVTMFRALDWLPQIHR